MTANTWKDWLKRYGLIAILVLVTILYIVSKFIPKNHNKSAFLQKAKDEIKRIKNTSQYDLSRHKKEMKNRKTEISNIKKIKDEKQRLDALANFAFRHRRK